MASTEHWRSYEARVDPTGELAPSDRVRRAKISCRAHMRSIARKSVKALAAKRARQGAVGKRQLATQASERELERFRAQREEWITTQILWAATQRGERGIAQLRERQLKVRSDCLLCRRPLSDADRAVLGTRTRRVESD